MIINNQPLVSVLMTVFNREEYIAEAIESVINSTYQNWELIIVDDRSTDNSIELARNYQAQDKRIKIYINEVNLGDYPNRNKAASYAKGKYLKYVDADDMIYPFGLELLVYYMEKNPNVGYGLCSIEQDDNELFPISLSPLGAYRRHYLNKKSIFHKAPLSSIIKRSVFEKENGFKNVRHFGDYEFWHRLSNTYDVLLMQHGIVWYRVSDGQEASIRKKNPLNALYTLDAALSNINCKLNPLPIHEKIKLLKEFKKTKAKLTVNTFKNHGVMKGRDFQLASGLGFIEILMLKFFN